MYLRHLFLLFALCCAWPARAAILESFRYANKGQLAAAWRAMGGAPDAQNATDGVAFLCPFDQDRDRVYWDRTANLDLSRFTSIELDLTCDRPEALRAFMIYFKSGNGWFVASQPMKAGGRQRLVFPKQAFTAEGNPTGWNRIDAIRISPWRGSPVRARLVLHQLEARTDQLFLIQSISSAPNAAERAVAERATERMSSWLRGAGIPHAILREDQLAADKLAGSKLLILPYNARPTASQLALYRKHLAAGGKLIVCFSESEELAKMMGVTLGEAISHREPGRLAGFRFENPNALHVPQTVYQQSWGLRLAQPQKGRGRVIANWINANGAPQPEPAWISTDAGFWMTHILLDDDRAGKEQLLTGLIGSLDSSVWATVAREAAANCGKIDGFGSLRDTVDGIAKLAHGHPDRVGINALLNQAEREQQQLNNHLANGQFVAATEQARAIRKLLTLAYSRAQRPPEKETRAIWDHDGVGWYPGDWNRTMRELKAAGINTIFVNTLWAGLAHYPSKSVPGSFTLKKYGDQMQAALDAARANGIAIHAWVVLWYIGNAPPEFQATLRKEGRLQQNANGTPEAWINPALPENQRYMLNAIEELARNYPVDGIHLDYIRFPSANADFSPASRRLFEEWYGRKIVSWPSAVQSGAPQTEFRRWRAGLITDFVRTLRKSLKGTNPKMKLSAAVWGGYPDTIPSIGQDWGLWLRNDLLDFVAPMNYSEDTYKFSALTQKQLDLPNAKGRILPGIGVTAAESQLRPDQVVEQIAIARRLGAPGFALYKLSQTMRQETLPLLSEGAIR
ncbi:MAG: family 10 glycosylhydrolase [Kiritimatiellae bacterium]|nr:family 10 glycosylhydrolase [Kiritimatiellia bacterium]